MKRASLSATPKWRPSTSKATPSIPSGITPSSPVPAKHQVEALISRSLLTQLIPSDALSRTGVVLLAIAGVTYVVDFIFPTEILPPGAPPTTVVGTIHLVAALFGWVLFTVGAILLSSRLKRDAYWKSWRPALLGLSWVSALLLVVLVAVVVSREPFGGLAEKAFILVRNLWALMLGLLAFNSPAASANVRERLAVPGPRAVGDPGSADRCSQ